MDITKKILGNIMGDRKSKNKKEINEEDEEKEFEIKEIEKMGLPEKKKKLITRR